MEEKKDPVRGLADKITISTISHFRESHRVQFGQKKKGDNGSDVGEISSHTIFKFEECTEDVLNFR